MEVYTGGKPVKPGRAYLVAATLLILTTVLAANMTAARQKQPLGPPVHPQGWAITFRPPRQFIPTSVVGRTRADIYPFVFARHGRQVLLTFERLVEPAGASPEAVVEETLLDSVRSISRSAIRTQARLGPLVGSEILDLANGVAARAARHDDSGTYVAALYVTEGELTPEIYALFEASCDSVELIDP